jgi:hypothetical protein
MQATGPELEIYGHLALAVAGMVFGPSAMAFAPVAGLLGAFAGFAVFSL